MYVVRKSLILIFFFLMVVVLLFLGSQDQNFVLEEKEMETSK
jgi:hypothetical protein